MDHPDCHDVPDTPCWLALTAGAMALMSAYANPRSDLPACEAARLRSLVACKLLSNLDLLLEHPHAPPPLRQVAAHVHAHWQALHHPAAPPRAPKVTVHAASPRLH
jgi:hypothetical protein